MIFSIKDGGDMYDNDLSIIILHTINPHVNSNAITFKYINKDIVNIRSRVIMNSCRKMNCTMQTIQSHKII